MSVRNVSRVREVINELGGTDAVMALTGRGRQAVSNWRSRERLPKELYLIMCGALKDRGCEAPSSLWGIPQPEARP